jgi:WXG100 family type VII secretion target
MSSPKIRAQYDELTKISSVFSAQSSAIAGVNRKVKSAQDTLQAGDWQGKGATKFYREMDGTINPSMKRLEKALAEAARLTKQISKIMKDAEDESSSIFKL